MRLPLRGRLRRLGVDAFGIDGASRPAAPSAVRPPPAALPPDPGTAVPECDHVAAGKASELDVERLRHVALQTERDVELEPVRRDPAELAPPVGPRRGPQDDAAARSAALVRPDEELAPALADELDRLLARHNLHALSLEPDS